MLTLRETADQINAHLKRIEAAGGSGFKQAGAYYMGGARIRLTYVSRKGGTTITRPKAQAFLDWLDAGHVGRHTDHVVANRVADTRSLDGAR